MEAVNAGGSYVKSKMYIVAARGYALMIAAHANAAAVDAVDAMVKRFRFSTPASTALSMARP